MIVRKKEQVCIAVYFSQSKYREALELLGFNPDDPRHEFENNLARVERSHGDNDAVSLDLKNEGGKFNVCDSGCYLVKLEDGKIEHYHVSEFFNKFEELDSEYKKKTLLSAKEAMLAVMDGRVVSRKAWNGGSHKQCPQIFIFMINPNEIPLDSLSSPIFPKTLKDVISNNRKTFHVGRMLCASRDAEFFDPATPIWAKYELTIDDVMNDDWYIVEPKNKEYEIS